MANSSINLVNLDFNAFKTSLKAYLTSNSQPRFKDYDFEGSNMSVLIDLLAYNTYLNSFYTNMVASEMFLDTAQLRDSVVSHAKELNYTPRSFTSAFANVNITITPASNAVSSVLIPAKTSFTSRVGSNTFTFTTKESIAITTSNNGVFTANNVLIYEGSYVTDSFVRNTQIDNQRFILTNPNIDTSSLQVIVVENSGANVYNFTQAFSLLDLAANSEVFFVQAAENEQYEILFGNSTSGKDPLNGAIIEVSYRASSGELPNGADTFINNSSIDGHSNVSIVTNKEAIGGSVAETIESIKFNAPRSFAAQERAITESDYRTLLLRKFPEIQAISVYGGEKEDPPQYGKVFIAVDIEGSDGVPELYKQSYVDYLSDKVPLGVTPEIVLPDFVYLSVTANVNYDFTSTTLSPSEIKTLVLNKIESFNNTYLNDFNSTFRYSNFVAEIDNSDNSILNNDTQTVPYFILNPTLNLSSSYTLKFNTPILITSPNAPTHEIQTDKGVYSTQFVFDNLNCILEDDGLGKIRIVRLTETEHVKVRDVGTIDYNSGTVIISDLVVSSYTGNGIKLYAKPTSKDFTSTLKNILKINLSDVIVNVIPTRR